MLDRKGQIFVLNLSHFHVPPASSWPPTRGLKLRVLAAMLITSNPSLTQRLTPACLAQPPRRCKINAPPFHVFPEMDSPRRPQNAPEALLSRLKGSLEAPERW
jgi:hypothetical protein